MPGFNGAGTRPVVSPADPSLPAPFVTGPTISTSLSRECPSLLSLEPDPSSEGPEESPSRISPSLSSVASLRSDSSESEASPLARDSASSGAERTSGWAS